MIMGVKLRPIRGFLSSIFVLLVIRALRIDGQSSFGPYDDLQYPNDTLQAALLVQRDISLDIPISHILLPGIDLTSSWFWTREYTVDNITAISNLFDMGYRRFELDLWWNNATNSFQICPEQIITNSTTSGTQVITSAVTTTMVGSSTTSFSAAFTTTISASPTSSFAAPDPSVPISLTNSYSCAPGANFQLVLNTIASILSRTNNVRQAGLIILVLNLYTLPSSGRNGTVDLSLGATGSLSSQIETSFAEGLYTPANLASDRQNINTTFLKDTTGPIIDIPAYYDLIFNNTTGTASTPNGWPTTRYLFETQSRRLLIGFGTVNVSTEEYDISQDTSVIYPPATFGGSDQLIPSTNITNNIDSCLGPQGVVFGPSGQENFSSTSIGGNMTFAISEYPPPNSPLTYDSLQGIVMCGLSAIMDSPLQNTNSGSISPILPIAGTIWSWQPPSEPQNTSVPTNGTNNVLACAALNLDSGYWVVLECDTSLNIACRVNNSLYEWQIGSQTSYFQATDTCPPGTTFDVPRTPLENRFLLSVLRKTQIKSIWIDLNSLKAPDCWTVGNANCPYGNSVQSLPLLSRSGAYVDEKGSGLKEQRVIVPIVASILVISVFFLMCLVKWQRYWIVRAAKKRRRLVKGFLEYADYEGIPA